MVVFSSILLVLIFIGAANANDGKAKETTLVTAYFDFGAKSTKDYLTWFKQWARIKNTLIVFCQNNSTKNEILNVRKNYGLEDETKIVIIPDIFAVDEYVFKKMLGLSTEPHFQQFKKAKNAGLANDAKYNYLSNLKPYFIKKAVADFSITTENIAWIDFGFNRGGEFYSSSEEDWSFELTCGPSDKVRLYHSTAAPSQRALFEIIRIVKPDNYGGDFFVCPRKLVDSLYDLYNESLRNMVNIDFTDNDQPVFLLAYRTNPDLIEMTRSFSFLPVKQFCNGNHLKFNNNFLSATWVQDEQKDFILRSFNLPSNYSSVPLPDSPPPVIPPSHSHSKPQHHQRKK